MMSDIFIIYAHGDKERVRPIANALAQRWEVFWDEDIALGADWIQALAEKMNTVKLAMVFWSQHSIASVHVSKEVAEARKRGILIPVLLDKGIWGQLPVGDGGAGTIQAVDLSGWSDDDDHLDHREFKRLLAHLEVHIAASKPAISMPLLMPGDMITERHLNLVHSSWRAPESEQEKTDRSKNFELRELANGYSVIYAEVILKDSIRRFSYSRFINLTETGPWLKNEFFRLD